MPCHQPIDGKQYTGKITYREEATRIISVHRVHKNWRGYMSKTINVEEPSRIFDEDGDAVEYLDMTAAPRPSEELKILKLGNR